MAVKQPVPAVRHAGCARGVARNMQVVAATCPRNEPEVM